MWDNKRLDAGKSMTDGSGDESGAGGGDALLCRAAAASATPVIL